jgi:hypothetical protein
MLRLITATLLLWALPAFATVTASSSVAIVADTDGDVACTLTSVPANSTIVLGILNRTDESTTISTIADDVNGSWALSYVDGPVDSTATTFRSWLAYRNGVSAGTTVTTVTFSGSITSNLACGYITSSEGAMTFDDAAVTYQAAGNETSSTSNNADATGAGAIVGLASFQNGQTDPEPTGGAGEDRMNANGANSRAHLFFEDYASSGAYGFSLTIDSAAPTIIVGAFLEPGGGGGSVVNPFSGRGGSAAEPITSF